MRRHIQKVSFNFLKFSKLCVPSFAHMRNSVKNVTSITYIQLLAIFQTLHFPNYFALISVAYIYVEQNLLF